MPREGACGRAGAATASVFQLDSSAPERRTCKNVSVKCALKRGLARNGRGIHVRQPADGSTGQRWGGVSEVVKAPNNWLLRECGRNKYMYAPARRCWGVLVSPLLPGSGDCTKKGWSRMTQNSKLSSLQLLRTPAAPGCTMGVTAHTGFTHRKLVYLCAVRTPSLSGAQRPRDQQRSVPPSAPFASHTRPRGCFEPALLGVPSSGVTFR